MAIQLLASGSGCVDYGDISALAGVTGITIAVTFKPVTVANDRRIASQWGVEGNQGFLFATQDTDELGFVLSGTGSFINFYGRKTTSLNLANGSTYRVVAKIGGLGGTPTTAIWVNGSSASLTDWFSSTPTALFNSSHPVRVGRDAGGSSGLDADYSDFAIWGEAVPDWVAVAYGKGFSPLAIGYKSNLILYSRFLNTGDANDIWGGRTGTLTGGANAAHPGVIYPKKRQSFGIAGEGVEPPSFNPAWARLANVVLQPGVMA